MPISSLPPARGIRVERQLDRQNILSSTTARIDRIWAFQVDDRGRIGCHEPDNVRLTDWARNKARCPGSLARQSGIFEDAVLTNLVLRPALGDIVADHILAELLTALPLAIPDLGQAKASVHAYDFPDSHRGEIRQVRRAEQDWYILNLTGIFPVHLVLSFRSYSLLHIKSQSLLYIEPRACSPKICGQSLLIEPGLTEIRPPITGVQLSTRVYLYTFEHEFP
ncbi:hypothetical protein BCV69DRAFT_220951 [Microstroma glucosiphilum]|uniref:Uncharacterized protein n=1 Tax=Pseudomicrostroma glucosiphilum TaxID=1684307 RepID=A0A316U4F2_9BASI|nr:hypothetical protein BCV69DRAFT_220951 [Pseudomicrostroma glucosiphilum]PWN20137.1 hypothetical protein BCV69DRAFT_220951 [Pseudomicrostroma glucosiphilum]